MNVSTPSAVERHNGQNEETDAPPAYSPGMAESTDVKAAENEDKTPMAEETIAQKIARLLREKDELLENEEEEKNAVNEAWLERCEAWNRFQESRITKGEHEYHQTTIAWEKLRNIRERTRLRLMLCGNLRIVGRKPGTAERSKNPETMSKSPTTTSSDQEQYELQIITGSKKVGNQNGPGN
ncbi:hypothetical protein IFR04_004815 [Cadophora malorum]|uniref:Uncharacterized protein n=1 Tax=Cadophora malorum TaxID=108018 RepID=A0A8H7WC29_9HELO|nr:hypothetical protein IFR04_004815 [Cadophora malorum]